MYSSHFLFLTKNELKFDQMSSIPSTNLNLPNKTISFYFGQKMFYFI